MDDATRTHNDVKDVAHRVVLTITLPAACIILVGVLLAFGLGFWRMQSINHDSIVRSHNTDTHASLQAAYLNCVAIGQEKKEMKAVVDAAFKSSTTTVDITVLPARTQELLAEVAPYFRLLATATGDRGTAVRDTIKSAPVCHKPPLLPGEKVVQTTSPTTTTTTQPKSTTTTKP